jgi:hypothetical protein
MAILRVTDESTLHSVPDAPAHRHIHNLDRAATLEGELDAMVASVMEMSEDGSTPDILMSSCMAYQARCTEIYLGLVRIENRERKAKQFRTQQLQKVMDLLEYTFRGASRLIEIRRQEIELNR